MDNQNFNQQVPPTPSVYNQVPNVTPVGGGSHWLKTILAVIISVAIILGAIYFFLNYNIVAKSVIVPVVDCNYPQKCAELYPVQVIQPVATTTTGKASTTPIKPIINVTKPPVVTPSVTVVGAGKDMKTFNFPVGSGVAVSAGVIGTNSINVTMPAGTNKSSLIASFTFSAGATVSVNGVKQVSGITANNFTSPVNYIVTGSDGSTKIYTVTVIVTAPTLTWSDEQGDFYNLADATARCSSLGAGWRLPTITELKSALTDQFVNGGSNPGGFMDSKRYWSGSKYGDIEVWYAVGYPGSKPYVASQHEDVVRWHYHFATRCVK